MPKLLGHGTGIGSTIDLDTTMGLADRTKDKGTSMKWSAEAKIGARIASIGSKLIGSQPEKNHQAAFRMPASKARSSR